MTKAKAIVLGIFTIWPIIYMFIFILFGFLSMIFITMNKGHENGPPMIFFVIFILHFFTILEIFALIAIYIIYLFKTDAVPDDKKALWAVVLFLGSMITMPVFWYLYIWKKLETNILDIQET